MPDTYAQTDRPIKVSTPLGGDALLLLGFKGSEGISRLFHFDVHVLAENKTDVAFDKLLGQPIVLTQTLPNNKTRHYHGICNRISQGARDVVFTSYHLEIVPQFWLLTKRVQSRIFQHITVPDILKKVLEGLDVAIEPQGTFQPRDYCVQYRESDFNFACRLMEEEGIFYFFKHTPDGHKMVLSNTAKSHPPVPGNDTIIYEKILGGTSKENRINSWEKMQELRSGKVTLWDHCFEMPGKHLDANDSIKDGVQVGAVNHKFKVAGNDKLELYDYPGGYAGRFDGINRGGGEQPAEVQKIFEDNKRVASIRMQQEAAGSLVIKGESTCGNLASGHKFTLERHFNADGDYVLTSVEHSYEQAINYRSGGFEGLKTDTKFTCIPAAVPFRPPQVTPKSFVKGTHTAVVVGPGGEEIFTDKYGRVKVQFHWDRAGKNDGDSSCWVRVGSVWAGKQWGYISIPRIGQEVIVDFLEGDPNDPIIIGSVYNAEQMPPYALPANKTQSGVVTRSTLGGGGENFNELRFEDKKGVEYVYLRAEKDHIVAVENDETKWVGRDRWEEVDHDRTLIVGHDKSEEVKHNKEIEVVGSHTEKIGGGMDIAIGSTLTESVLINYTETVGGAMQIVVGAAMSIAVGGLMSETVGMGKSETVGGAKSETIGGGKTLSIGKDFLENIGKNRTTSITKTLDVQVGEDHKEAVKKNYLLQAKKIQLVAEDEINIKTGSAEIVMKKNGDITITGGKINVKGSGDVIVKGSNIKMN